MSAPNFPDKQTLQFIDGAAGRIECLLNTPKTAIDKTLIICHPHPQHGGTMHNKVVTTIHRAADALGLRSIRFNYRGVGKSEGSYDHGKGETDDLLAVIAWLNQARPNDELWLAGFSFGAYISYRATTASTIATQVKQLISIAPPVQYPEFAGLAWPQCRWLLVQGGKDEVVDVNAVEQWFKLATPTPNYSYFADAGHFFHGQLVTLKQRLIEQLTRTH